MPRPAANREPDAREVHRVDAVVAAEGDLGDWPAHCVIGSLWIAQIRTAEVRATIVARTPLGTFDETICTCLSLRLDLPVPVEPGLRFHLHELDDPHFRLSGVVRPWGG